MKIRAKLLIPLAALFSSAPAKPRFMMANRYRTCTDNAANCGFELCREPFSIAPQSGGAACERDGRTAALYLCDAPHDLRNCDRFVVRCAGVTAKMKGASAVAILFNAKNAMRRQTSGGAIEYDIAAPYLTRTDRLNPHSLAVTNRRVHTISART